MLYGYYENEEKQLYYSDLWIRLCKNSREELLNYYQINDMNKRNFEKSYLNDIFSKDIYYSDKKVKEIINGVSKIPNATLYKNNVSLDEIYYNNLMDNLNIDNLREEVKISYGITIRRTKMKTFPTDDRVFSRVNEYALDRFMESAVYINEPCMIYCESKDGNWLFCETYYYSGWVKKCDIAVEEKSIIQEYCTNKRYIIVTGKKILLGYNPIDEELNNLSLDMGIKLFINENVKKDELIFDMHSQGNYVVYFPRRDDTGKLYFSNVLIPFNEDIHEGYLKCSRANILKQIFKFQGERYGWGGDFYGRDCSSLIIDTLRCFGILFPRNTGDQLRKSIGKTYFFNDDDNYNKKIDIINSLRPGTLLYLNGHVVMIIGRYKGNTYIIHDTIGVQIIEKKECGIDCNKFISINGVTISKLKEIYTSSGKSYIDSIVGFKDIFE